MSIIWLVWWFFVMSVFWQCTLDSLSIVHYRVTLLKSWNPESSDVLSSVSFLNTEIVTRSISCCSSSLNVIMCDGFVHVVALHIDSELEFSIFLVEKKFLNFFCLYFFFSCFSHFQVPM